MEPIPSHKALTKRIGRPVGSGEFDPSYCDIASEMCARGATIAELAEEFGVTRMTIYRWMAKYQGFCDAIRVAREAADERVGFSMYERAVGYTYNAVKIMQHEGDVIYAKYLEHIPPDVGAQKHWLANRQPDKWRDVKDHRIDATDAFVELLRNISPSNAKLRVVSGGKAA